MGCFCQIGFSLFFGISSILEFWDSLLGPRLGMIILLHWLVIFLEFGIVDW